MSERGPKEVRTPAFSGSEYDYDSVLLNVCTSHMHDKVAGALVAGRVCDSDTLVR